MLCTCIYIISVVLDLQFIFDTKFRTYQHNLSMRSIEIGITSN